MGSGCNVAYTWQEMLLWHEIERAGRTGAAHWCETDWSSGAVAAQAGIMSSAACDQIRWEIAGRTARTAKALPSSLRFLKQQP